MKPKKPLTRAKRAALIKYISTTRATNYDLASLIDIAQHAEAEALAKLSDEELIDAGKGDEDAIAEWNTGREG